MSIPRKEFASDAENSRYAFFWKPRTFSFPRPISNQETSKASSITFSDVKARKIGGSRSHSNSAPLHLYPTAKYIVLVGNFLQLLSMREIISQELNGDAWDAESYALDLAMLYCRGMGLKVDIDHLFKLLLAVASNYFIRKRGLCQTRRIVATEIAWK
ncbi:hypothetical protein BDN70DRAFT_379530 [Pholiota conissans]|uniref:Uncharacterized protein n=1 Tax=Pholiota conissans TaxID=109636 RepID=A0A9P6D487_9AGAR|nr:hypothetical protein BDN70DRAFT_379530 [Pholiota conissans]